MNQQKDVVVMAVEMTPEVRQTAKIKAAQAGLTLAKWIELAIRHFDVKEVGRG